MASAKDTFEANIFEANMFASGMWRGIGVNFLAGPFTIDAQDSYNAGAVTQGSFSGGEESFGDYNAGGLKQEGAS